MHLTHPALSVSNLSQALGHSETHCRHAQLCMVVMYCFMPGLSLLMQQSTQPDVPGAQMGGMFESGGVEAHVSRIDLGLQGPHAAHLGCPGMTPTSATYQDGRLETPVANSLGECHR